MRGHLVYCFRCCAASFSGALGASAGFAGAQCGTSVLWHNGGIATTMLASDTRLYAAGPNQLRILDMTDPAVPVELSTYIVDGKPRVMDRGGRY